MSAARPYFDVCKDATSSPLERETALLSEWNATRHENSRLRGAMARLCRAVSLRMMPDEPTPEDRMELREAFDTASDILHNNQAGSIPRQNFTP
jgi:hypothetical protein